MSTRKTGRNEPAYPLRWLFRATGEAYSARCRERRENLKRNEKKKKKARSLNRLGVLRSRIPIPSRSIRLFNRTCTRITIIRRTGYSPDVHRSRKLYTSVKDASCFTFFGHRDVPRRPCVAREAWFDDLLHRRTKFIRVDSRRYFFLSSTSHRTCLARWTGRDCRFEVPSKRTTNVERLRSERQRSRDERRSRRVYSSIARTFLKSRTDDHRDEYSVFTDSDYFPFGVDEERIRSKGSFVDQERNDARRFRRKSRTKFSRRRRR